MLAVSIPPGGASALSSDDAMFRMSAAATAASTAISANIGTGYPAPTQSSMSHASIASPRAA